MSRETLKTLFHPFENGVLDMPASGRALFYGAEPGFRLPQGFGAEICAVQPLKSLFDGLKTAGVSVAPERGEGPFDLSLVLLTKHRGENENHIADALANTVPGGLIVIAGAKEEGVQSMRKRLSGLIDGVESMPKYHGVVIWFARPEKPEAAIAALTHPAVEIDGRFTTVPGLFSHDRIDEGSRLLGERLPEDFAGLAADFGAGWGYLSAMLIETAPRLGGLDLYEADHRALERARVNLAGKSDHMPVKYFWQDLTAGPVKTRYDLIIMNPPFHAAGQAAEPALGQTIIETACAALKPGGKLMLVANRGLPYEDILAKNCRQHGEDYRNARFKILWGVK
ncbi:class I SAM-dependent methyltransferase [Martelella alba]|uniref:Class I SAM-dependent methyltransferase n=1 Tax=Martelella alba TaxID=2590451 RepID=A0A506UGS1_9HYPH|nr:class I SAM-dependent methyltransferase [Martelella alba]TPW32429.1 class I SAM-dependent methyltransferase [Martelella alba]